MEEHFTLTPVGSQIEVQRRVGSRTVMAPDEFTVERKFERQRLMRETAHIDDRARPSGVPHIIQRAERLKQMEEETERLHHLVEGPKFHGSSPDKMRASLKHIWGWKYSTAHEQFVRSRQ